MLYKITFRGPFKVHKNLEAKIIVLKLVPGFDDGSIYALIRHSDNLRAIVLELYGTGNGPSNKGSLLNAIEEATCKGIIVVATSQCLRGGVYLETYSLGREFLRKGVLSAGDMTTEACVTKLAYLCGRLEKNDDISTAFTKSLRGEITLL